MVLNTKPIHFIIALGCHANMAYIMQESRQDHFRVITLFFSQLGALNHMLQLRYLFAGIFRSTVFFIRVEDLIRDLLRLFPGHNKYFLYLFILKRYQKYA